MQYPRTLENKIHHSNKRRPPPFFHSGINPVLGHVLIHFVNKAHALTVTVELIWLLFLNNLLQLCSNARQITVRLAGFRRSFVSRPAVVLTNHTSYTTSLLYVRWAVQSGHIYFVFCCCLYPFFVVEHTCCSNVVNSKVWEQTKGREIVINKNIKTNTWS